jgi:hypothetical protein
MKKYLSFIVLFIFLHALDYPGSLATVEAKLVESLLSDLLSESELIVKAIPIEIHIGESGEGWALMEIREFYKGITDQSKIRIEWSSEEHEQQFLMHRQEYLLFLKSTKSRKYTGTHYGRSYWHLKIDVNHSPITLYHYPITMIKINYSSILKPAKYIIERWPEMPMEVETKAIYISDIINILLNNKLD